MQKRWMNNGEPDAEGFYEMVIENRNGQVVSRYRAKTHKELAEMAMESQVNANRQIGRLMQPDQGRTPLKLEPHELSDGDTLRIAQELDSADPSKKVAAVNQIIEARMGGRPEAVASELNTVSQERSDAFYRAEADAFTKQHPEYYPVKENMQLLFRELMARQIDLTRNNLELVYRDLMEKGEMIAWPSTTGEPEGGGEPDGGGNPPPASRPRQVLSIATGIRNQDANGAPPPPPKKKPVTRAEIENMSRAEYMERLRNPEFRKAVDAMA